MRMPDSMPRCDLRSRGRTINNVPSYTTPIRSTLRHARFVSIRAMSSDLATEAALVKDSGSRRDSRRASRVQRNPKNERMARMTTIRPMM
jgi:hypothetical protein